MRTDQLVRVASIALTVSATLVGLAVLWQLRVPIALCFLAFGISAALEPSLQRLAEKMPKWVAIAIVYALLAIVFVAIPVALAQPLSTEITRLVEDFQNATKDGLPHDAGRVQQWLALALPEVQAIGHDMLVNDPSETLWQVFGFTWGAFELAGNLLVVFVLSIYWSVDHDRFERLWLSLLSVEKRGQARDVLKLVQFEIGGYLRSEAVQCVAAGLWLGIGYTVIGFPYPAALAVLGAIAWLIPWGGILVAAAATLLLSIPAILTVGDPAIWTHSVPALLYTLAVFAVLEHFIEPRFFARYRYNSLLVVLVAIVFTESFGFAGLLLAPPVSVTLQIIAGYFLRLRGLAATTTAGRTAIDVRLKQLWTVAVNDNETSPEVVNLLERLTAIATEVRVANSSS